MRPRPLLALGLWAGFLTGVGELGYVGLRRFVRGLFGFRGPETLWMTPLATALLFAVLAGVLALLWRRADPSARWRRAAGVFAGMAAASGMWLFPPLHKGAALLIAAGIGVQAARLTGRFEPGLTTLVRRTLPAMGALLLVTLLAVTGLDRWRERQALAAAGPARPDAPNVLLLVLDTVRSLSLSAYGYPRPTSPALAALARRGTRFDRALSTAPWTLPSHASLFTGTWPHAQTTDWFAGMDERDPTLAEALGAAGYRTGGFVANVSYVSRETGLARGFGRYEDYPVTPGTFLTSASLVRTVVETPWIRRLAGTDQLVGRKHAADVNADFLSWLDAGGDRPFFAFLNYYDAHTPYLPPSQAWRTRFATPGIPPVPNLERRETRDSGWTPAQVQGAIDAYDGAIAYLDDQLGRLFEQLAARGLLDRTLVIVTSDHGEEFMEHGLIHHGNSLYLPSLQVPLVLAWPGHVPADTSVAVPVSLRDVPATVLDLAGVTDGPRLPGASLARFWQGTTAPDDTLLAELKYAPQQPDWYPASKGDMLSAVQAGQRYIRTGDGTEELFDFDGDPAERTDLSRRPSYGPDLARFRRLLQGVPGRPR